MTPTDFAGHVTPRLAVSRNAHPATKDAWWHALRDFDLGDVTGALDAAEGAPVTLGELVSMTRFRREHRRARHRAEHPQRCPHGHLDTPWQRCPDCLPQRWAQATAGGAQARAALAAAAANRVDAAVRDVTR